MEYRISIYGDEGLRNLIECDQPMHKLVKTAWFGREVSEPGVVKVEIVEKDDTLYTAQIPVDTLEALEGWANATNLEPGGFITAILENNLREALGRADLRNRAAIFPISQYVFNKLPWQSWGSVERVVNWRSIHCGGGQ